jgi:uncharacterized protein YgiM (DUF1202 family)
MKFKSYYLLIILVVVLLFVSGCGLSRDERSQAEIDSQATAYVAQTKTLESGIETVVSGTQYVQQMVETIVAQTLTAIAPAKGSDELTTVSTPTASPTPTSTLTQTPIPTPTPILTFTPTFTDVSQLPVVEVSVPTNCRIGPGKAYDIVSVLDVGEKAEVVGRNEDSSYWVVENPHGSGYCWLWGYYSIVTGDVANIPVWELPTTETATPTPTPTPTLELESVLLSVRVPTNCRVGPGKPYDIISILMPGTTVEVIARLEPPDFWVVQNPEGEGYCWVWDYYATVTGPIENLPIWDPTSTSTSTPTPTVAAVTLEVSVDTNCRTGPGKEYEIVTILRIGEIAEVIARNADGTYWVINNPENSGYCWLWDYYATVTGLISGLPVWDPPPIPTPTELP